jgi:hypothetical protein
LFRRSGRQPVLDQDVLALDVAVLTQTLAECLEPGRWPFARLQKSDSRHLPWLLPRRGERRGEEAEGDRADEGASVHYSIT